VRRARSMRASPEAAVTRPRAAPTDPVAGRGTPPPGSPAAGGAPSGAGGRGALARTGSPHAPGLSPPRPGAQHSRPAAPYAGPLRTPTPSPPRRADAPRGPQKSARRGGPSRPQAGRVRQPGGQGCPGGGGQNRAPWPPAAPSLRRSCSGCTLHPSPLSPQTAPRFLPLLSQRPAPGFESCCITWPPPPPTRCPASRARCRASTPPLRPRGVGGRRLGGSVGAPRARTLAPTRRC
jgi:hypothetical protein